LVGHELFVNIFPDAKDDLQRHQDENIETFKGIMINSQSLA